MRREYFRIPPEMRKDSNMQHILVHDNLVVFWIFIQFQLRQSNYVQYRSAYLQVVNSNASAKIYRSLWFYFCRHFRTFCECHYIHIWEICIPRSVQAKQILIGRFVECQSIKKVGGRRSVEELYQALFFVSPFPPECFTERNENRAWTVFNAKRPVSAFVYNGYVYIYLKFWNSSITITSLYYSCSSF